MTQLLALEYRPLALKFLFSCYIHILLFINCFRSYSIRDNFMTTVMIFSHQIVLQTFPITRGYSQPHSNDMPIITSAPSLQPYHQPHSISHNISPTASSTASTPQSQSHQPVNLSHTNPTVSAIISASSPHTQPQPHVPCITRFILTSDLLDSTTVLSQQYCHDVYSSSCRLSSPSRTNIL